MRDWYKRSIIYSLDVDAYRDGNGDGVGDFHGLRKSLPYLSSLGVDCLWLLPFYDTPNRDDGYDVMNYYSVDSRLGNLGTFAEFMDAAKEYNIRVIIDLVANHTSDQNPWFLEALKGPDNQYHDYYIWADEIPDDYEPKMIFGEHQSGNWKYVQEINRYFYHTFYEFQPDLNLANPLVRDEIRRIMRFWLKMGVAGFRMDGVTHMIRKKHDSQIKDNNSFLNWMTMAITARRRCTEFGEGQYRFLETDDDRVMIHLCERNGSLAMAVHNFSDSEKRVPLHIESRSAEQLIDVFCDHPYSPAGLSNGEVLVGPKGYRWFRTGF